VSSLKEICWGPTIYFSKQNKIKLKAKIKTLQEKHIAYEAIKYSVLKDDLIFLLMKKGCRGASPRFDACTSWIFLGVTWASSSLRFYPYFISSHHSPFPTLENFLHTKLHIILISNISLCKIVNPLLVQFQLKYSIY
jgi:hypothetical protein